MVIFYISGRKSIRYRFYVKCIDFSIEFCSTFNAKLISKGAMFDKRNTVIHCAFNTA